MFVENLNEENLTELCFRILVERVHKFPKISLELKSVKNIVKGYNSVSFEMEFIESKSKSIKTTKITANDFELFINGRYNATYSKILKQYLSELYDNYKVPTSNLEL